MADYQLPPWQFETGHQMEVAEVGELSYLYFPAFRAYPKLRHGFSTRQGGVSEDYLGTMNFSFDRGDGACAGKLPPHGRGARRELRLSDRRKADAHDQYQRNYDGRARRGRPLSAPL